MGKRSKHHWLMIHDLGGDWELKVDPSGDRSDHGDSAHFLPTTQNREFTDRWMQAHSGSCGLLGLDC
jgi:hypothetical protein